MTKILALHFGHNSHAVILNDGHIDSYIQRERISCNKDQGGINKVLIEKCLSDSNININGIEQVVVTNTQYREFYFEDYDYFNFNYSPNYLNSEIDKFFKENINNYIKSYEIFHSFFSESNRRISEVNIKQYPQLLQYINKTDKKINLPLVPYLYTNRLDFNQIRKSFVEKIDSPFQKSREWAIKNFFIPINAYLDGKQLPGFLVDHHYAHIYSSAVKSKFQKGLVFSSDGAGSSPLGNLACIKKESGIFPIAHCSFQGGRFYELCATVIGLDCGKFMGLASYGKSNIDFIDLISKELKFNLNNLSWQSFLNCYQNYFSVNLQNNKYDILSKEVVNYAANVQTFFELCFLKTITALNDTVKKNLDEKSEGIILSGGSSLNCPSNSLIAEKIGYKNVFIEPSCNDEGLGFGAAMALENVINKKLSATYILDNKSHYSSPFHGPLAISIRSELIDELSNELIFKKIENISWSDDVAKMLLNGLTGIIIKDKSEIGPRALGNRSIIAIPDNYDVLNKVNSIKNREQWRPLAPACLEKYFNYFFNGPKNPYMLMTCKAKNIYFPGVIHVDGSSRVQCVDKSSKNFYLILNTIDDLIKEPILLLNTSCNRKGEPIINDVNIALDYLRTSEIDFLVTDQYIITKKS
tara:strand:- start:580 stop:2499 length:1920 start_codon:yes stop_codon:yes gene_type:complete